jgi:hypothetical protein
MVVKVCQIPVAAAVAKVTHLMHLAVQAAVVV